MPDGKSFGISAAESSLHSIGLRVAEDEGAALTVRPLRKVPAIVGVLRSGQIDARAIVPHIAKPPAASGAAHVIGDVADCIPAYQVTTIFTSKSNAGAERDPMSAVLAASSQCAAEDDDAMIEGPAGRRPWSR